MAYKYRKLPLKRSTGPGLRHSFTTSDLHHRTVPEEPVDTRGPLPSSTGSHKNAGEYRPLLVPVGGAQERGKLHGVLQKLSRRRPQQRELSPPPGKENSVENCTTCTNYDSGEAESRELLGHELGEVLNYSVGKRRRSIDNGSFRSPLQKNPVVWKKLSLDIENEGIINNNADSRNLKRSRSLAIKRSNISHSLSKVVEGRLEALPRPPSSQSTPSIEESASSDVACQMPLLGTQS